MRGLGLCLVCGLLAGCSDEPVQVSNSGFGAFEPSLAAIDGGLAVAWNDNRHGNDEIYLRLLDEGLAPRSEEIRLTQSPELSYEAALASVDGKLAVAWYDRDPAGRLAVQLGLWNIDGTPVWSRRVSSPGLSGRIPVLQPFGEDLFIAWVEDPADENAPSNLWGAIIDEAGTWHRAPFVIAPASRTTWNLNADALDDGPVAVVYDAEAETNASELYLALVASTETSVTRLSANDGYASKYPDIAIHDGAAALAWFDMKDGNEEVYLALFDPRMPGVETSGTRITQTGGESIGAYLAWNGATLGLAWNDNDAGQHEIFFQTFDAAGKAVSPPRQLTHTDAQSLIPSIVAHGTGFALAWNEAVYGGGGHEGDMGATRSEIAATTVE